MYRPEGRSKAYILVVLVFASLIAWAFFRYYRPVLIEESCTEVAQNSSELYRDKQGYDTNYTFATLKSKCVDEASAASK